MNMKVLFFDTETTGLPLWGEPSGSEIQPHIVEIAAKLCEVKEDKVILIEGFEAIIKPDGWVIPKEVSDIHGITTEQALEEGIEEKEAVKKFIELHASSDLRSGHNLSFDDRILRIAFKRYFNDELAESYKEQPKFCTMWESLNICQLPPTEAMLKRNMKGYKKPSLAEAYKHFTGKEMENAHRAMADVDAAIEVYKGIKGF